MRVGVIAPSPFTKIQPPGIFGLWTDFGTTRASMRSQRGFSLVHERQIRKRLSNSLTR